MLEREISSGDRNGEMKATMAMLMSRYHRAAVSSSGTQVHRDHVTSDAPPKGKPTEAAHPLEPKVTPKHSWPELPTVWSQSTGPIIVGYS